MDNTLQKTPLDIIGTLVRNLSRPLLLAGVAVAATPASAFIRQVAPDLAITHISPNGRYMISEVRGYVEIFDLENGTKDDFYGDYDLGEDYSCGFGNAISDTGVAVMSTSIDGNACVVSGGKITELSVPRPELTNLAHGITPDASRICGQIGNQAMSVDATDVMCVPCLWELQADGTYSEPIILPYPDRDFTGRIPQYVTAIAISDDGRTIAGQVRDFSGMLTQPILYTQDAKGEWSYRMLFPELTNPDGIVLPPDPGEAPQDVPQVEDFMTEEEKQAYADALQAWEDEGTWDYSTYPEMENFLSAEEKSAYEEAYADYQARLQAWEEAYLPFQEALQQILATSSSYLFNCVFLTPDGTGYASTMVEEVEDNTSWTGFSSNMTPVLMNLSETGDELVRLDAPVSMQASCVTADKTVLANTDGLTYPKQCYIALKGEEDWQPLDTWLNSVNPETGAWFKESATHDVEVYVDFSLELLEDYLCSGVAICNPDMSMFATYSEILWESDSAYFTESYIFSLSEGNGILNIASGEAEAVATEWYSLDGRRLREAPENGVAIRRVLYKDGSSRSKLELK